MKRIVVGVTGASGSIYGYRLLTKLRQRKDAQIHLVLSRAAEKTSYLELGYRSSSWKQLGYFSYGT